MVSGIQFWSHPTRPVALRFSRLRVHTTGSSIAEGQRTKVKATSLRLGRMVPGIPSMTTISNLPWAARQITANHTGTGTTATWRPALQSPIHPAEIRDLAVNSGVVRANRVFGSATACTSITLGKALAAHLIEKAHLD